MPFDLQRGVSIVVPVYNGHATVPLLVEDLVSVARSTGEWFEIVLVNDGSRDRSWETICDLTRQKSWVRGIRLMRNFGQHNALLCGIRACRYSVIVTLDDDGQNPPEEIPKLIHMLHEGYDLVFGHGFEFTPTAVVGVVHEGSLLAYSK